MFKRSLVSFGILCVTSMSAGAQQISSQADPSLTGSTLVDFSSATLGSYASLTFGNLTLTGIGGLFRIDNGYSGSYGTTGNSLDNNQGQTQIIRFSFATAVDALGFGLGAADTRASNLTLYDASSNVLASYATPFGPNYDQYTGFAVAGISYADLTLQAYGSGSYDYVLIDDVRYVDATATPEPASLALLGTGLLALIPIARRRSRS